MARALARARIPQGGYTVRMIIRTLPRENRDQHKEAGAMNDFEELARSTLYPVTSTNLIARALSAVMEATREHLQAEQGVMPCDDSPDGDGTVLGPKCRADIARRAKLILEKK